MFLGGVGRLMRALASGTTFSPIDLFASGAPGVWYDPSDLSTMFQDAAGTTPVTAVEQPVGLRLDKSRGLVLGSELVTNGDFSNGTTGWTLIKADQPNGTETAILTGGKIRITSPSSSPSTYCQFTSDAFPTVVGKTYKVVTSAPVIVSGSSLAFIGTRKTDTTLPGTNIVNIVNYQDGVLSGNGTGYFVATATSTRIVFQVNKPLTGTLVVDFGPVSIKEIPGSHAFQTTDINRPVLSARYNLLTRTEEFDNAAWSGVNINAFGSGSVVNTTATTDPLGTNTAEYIQENTSNGGHGVTQSWSATTGVAYSISVSFKAAQRSFGFIRLSGTPNLTAFFNLSNGTLGTIPVGMTGSITSLGNGWYRASVLWTSTVTVSQGVVFGMASTDGVLSYVGDGTSGIYLWGADLRVSNDGVGLPAYQRVTTATDYDTSGFPLYLRYNGTNSTMQTAAIDFTSTDKMSVFAGVRKLSDALGALPLELSADTNTNNGSFFLAAPVSDATANFAFRVRGTTLGTASVTNSAYAAPVTNVLTGTANIAGDSVILRANGTQVAQSTADLGSGNFGNHALNIGSRAGSSAWFQGRDYGLIVLGRTATATEIANTENYMEVKTFGKDMNYVYVDQVFAADGVTEITAADGDPIYMRVEYQ